MARRVLFRAGEGALLTVIQEYALEPDLVATWTDRRDYRYFHEGFGPGRGRLVSRFPKRWKALVYEAARGRATDVGMARVEELLRHISQRMVRRARAHYDSKAGNWLENALREHNERPFHAILARSNPEGHSDVLVGEEVSEASHERWAAKRTLTVAREARTLAAAVAPVLRNSSVILFVDPYFNPNERRYRRTLTAFLHEAMSARPAAVPGRVEVVLAADRPKSPEEEFFRAACYKRLCGCVPNGLRVVVRRVSERPGGQELHNRYILTDLGGIEFGHGLDEADEGETEDDLSLLDEEAYERRWNQYFGDPPPAFEQGERSVELIGERRSFQG